MRNLTIWQAVAYATELGLSFATTVVIGLLAGHAIDDRTGNAAPIFTVLGALLGFVAGVYGMTRLAQVLIRPDKE